MACPICEFESAERIETDAGNQWKVNCRACRTFEIVKRVSQMYANGHKRPRLSHGIRRMMRRDLEDYPFITEELAKKFVAEPLPSVQRQEDDFLIWIGDVLRESDPLGWSSRFDLRVCAAEIGSYRGQSAFELIRSMADRHLLNFREGFPNCEVILTHDGWAKYEQIKITPAVDRLAFMAMPFGKPDVERAFAECFVPAVKKTGFELRRIIDHQRAGLIDDRLRIEISQARFVIADLTYANLGAYWEAGFAEGLRRPVIYTCEKGFFDDASTKPHFDANHYLTVKWSLTDLSAAENELKAVIRVTLPNEALNKDPE